MLLVRNSELGLRLKKGMLISFLKKQRHSHVQTKKEITRENQGRRKGPCVFYLCFFFV